MKFAVIISMRRLWRRKLFAAISVVILASGIGVSAAAFSMVNALLFRALPVPNGRALVRVYRVSKASESLPINVVDYDMLRRQAQCFAQVAAYVIVTAEIEPGRSSGEARPGLEVSTNFLSVLGLQPMLGRDFLEDEDMEGRDDVVILTHAYWERRFAGDRDIVGRKVKINGVERTVIGVMPETFDNTENWAPETFLTPLNFRRDALLGRERQWVSVMGRLAERTSVASAQAQLEVLAKTAQRLPGAKDAEDLKFRVTAMASSAVDQATQRWYLVLVGIAAMVLIIACANLASVQIAGMLTRRHELAVCAALGGGCANLMAPLIMEAAIVTLAGGGLGLLVALWLNKILSVLFWGGYPLPVDFRVLGYTGCLLAAVIIALGLAPGWLSWRMAAGAALKDSKGKTRIKATLVCAQLTLSFVLASTAVSFAVAADDSSRQYLGWQDTGFVNAWVSNLRRYSQPEASDLFVRKLHLALEKQPGVGRVLVSSEEPLYGYFDPEYIALQGMGALPQQLVLSCGVEPDFFQELKIPLIAGRSFPEGLKRGDSSMVVVNAAFARRFWPDGDAVGKRIRLSGAPQSSEIIGVVGDLARPAYYGQPSSLFQIYHPLSQTPHPYFINVLVKTPLRPEAMVGTLRSAILGIDDEATVEELGGVRETIERMYRNTNDERTSTLCVFAAMGVLIAILGLYGVITQMTLQRTPEIGIRMAIGATPGRIAYLVFRDGLSFVLLSLVIGMLAYGACHRVYASIFPGMRFPGAYVQAGLALGFGIISSVALYIPSVRAAKLDPTVALHAE